MAVRTMQCPRCSSELMMSPTSASITCPFCQRVIGTEQIAADDRGGSAPSRSMKDLRDTGERNGSDPQQLPSYKRGRVKWYNAQKGYGFIRPSDGGSDLFVHHAAVEQSGRDVLYEDEEIEYQVSLKRGKPVAENLRRFEGQQTLRTSGSMHTVRSRSLRGTGDIANSTVRVVIGVILWVLAGLSLIVLVRDVHILNRIGDGTELLWVIQAYRQRLAFTEVVCMVVFAIPAYLLTHSHLQRTKPRIALAIASVAAILLGINASYVFMPEVPRLTYPTVR